MISMLITMTLVDGWGRRPMCVYGYMVTVVADFGMGATGMYNLTNNAALGSSLVFWACLATFSTTSASAIGYAYLAEIPKQDLRAKSAGWGLAIPNLFSIMFNYTVPLMIGGSVGWAVKTAFFFGCTGFIVVIVGWFIIPEVARRTPAEIDEMFEKKVKPRKFKGFVTDVEKDQAERDRIMGVQDIGGIHMRAMNVGPPREEA
jgi:MFS transporter, SP family, general alpha glucoside:H+ symporter